MPPYDKDKNWNTNIGVSFVREKKKKRLSERKIIELCKKMVKDRVTPIEGQIFTTYLTLLKVICILFE
jgi:hypothetical protein